MSDDDDETPTLHPDTLAALEEFYREQEHLKTIEEQTPDNINRVEFSENWQLSQFWYDDNTAKALAKEAIRVAGPGGKIALVSCPTIYKKLKPMQPEDSQVHLLEYDRRFAAYGSDFVFYDYNSPLDIPQDFSGSFDVVIVDPPFLSEECFTKVSVTVKFMAKDKIIVCTGAVMEDLVKKSLDVRLCNFEPKHKNNLANEFRCFANYDLDSFI